jgi:hypothetical protein
MGKAFAVAAVIALLAPAPTNGADPTPRTLSQREAEALLNGRARIDAKAAKVLARAGAAYGALKSLETVSDIGPRLTVARLMRPAYYHWVRQTRGGEGIALAIADGRSYYEYLHGSGQYQQRDAGVLKHLALDMNIRPFFAPRGFGETMNGLDGKPSVREYAFRYTGQTKLDGKKVDRLRVSTLVRGRDGSWQTFDGDRYFDAATGLLTRSVNGQVTFKISNRVNPKLPAEGFQWKPIPGVVKALN